MINKYQEALDVITDWFHSYTDDRGITVHERHITPKYQEAKETLQELIDKHRADKPIKTNDLVQIVYKCPDCGSEVRTIQEWALDDYPYHVDSGEPLYCDYCGKKLDWSD